ncbi:MAG: S4 domain-containing protein [bacterium]|nr:S4 domain-containing protein [bacterium]
MRIDLFLKKVGILDSRSKARNLVIKINGIEKKLSYEVKIGDEIEILRKDGEYLRFQVLNIPSKNVPRDKRDLYFKILEKGRTTHFLQREENFLKWLFENH